MTIPSLLDNDFYKFTMQQAIHSAAARRTARYLFVDRRGGLPADDLMLGLIRSRVGMLSKLALSAAEADWLARLGWFSDDYIAYLRDYRFDPGEVRIGRDSGGFLHVEVNGAWCRSILWEVPLLAIINQTWFETNAHGWSPDLRDYHRRSASKGRALARAGCVFSDFGSRRRRNAAAQEVMLLAMRDDVAIGDAFAGTSNLHFARCLGLKPIGTVAHEWTMAFSAINSVASADRQALREWRAIYPGQPKIALADTYGLDLFLANFDAQLAADYDGVRHDSGDPRVFTDRVLEHYRRCGVDPRAKTLVFSDSLDENQASAINRHVNQRARTAFGIGTRLTNDFPDGETLDIVIKLDQLDGQEVAKLGEGNAKATGSQSAVENARREVAHALAAHQNPQAND